MKVWRYVVRLRERMPGFPQTEVLEHRSEILFQYSNLVPLSSALVRLSLYSIRMVSIKLGSWYRVGLAHGQNQNSLGSMIRRLADLQDRTGRTNNYQRWLRANDRDKTYICWDIWMFQSFIDRQSLLWVESLHDPSVIDISITKENVLTNVFCRKSIASAEALGNSCAKDFRLRIGSARI